MDMSSWLGFSLSPLRAASSKEHTSCYGEEEEAAAAHAHAHAAAQVPFGAMPLRSDGSVCLLEPPFRTPCHGEEIHKKLNFILFFKVKVVCFCFLYFEVLYIYIF